MKQGMLKFLLAISGNDDMGGNIDVGAHLRHWVRTGNVPRRADFGPAFQDDWRHSAPVSAYMARHWVTREFGFALPCREALAAVKAISPIVEVAAGAGTWARLLHKNGADIIATDRNFRTGYGFNAGRLHPVARMSAADAIRKYPNRNVLMSWPCYDAEWSTEATRHIRPGRTLALISEGMGGCCGADSLFLQLAFRFRHIKTVRIPCWAGIHDRLELYRRII